MTSLSARAEATCLDTELLRAWPLADGGDKFARGTVLVVGGSASTPGAVMLAGESALRMGAGRLQIMTADAVAVAVSIAVPEAAVWATPVDEHGTLRCAEPLSDKVSAADVVLVGPGLTPGPGVARLVEWIARRAARSATVVLDAAAIGALAEARGADGLRQRIVLTPNEQELAALTDGDGGDEPSAPDIARRLGATITSFGVVAAADGRIWRLACEPSGLGTSGSGDVLAGLVAGAAARASGPEHAACWGTFAHAAAATALTNGSAPLGYIARELMRQVPQCLASVLSRDAGSTPP